MNIAKITQGRRRCLPASSVVRRSWTEREEIQTLQRSVSSGVRLRFPKKHLSPSSLPALLQLAFVQLVILSDYICADPRQHR